MNILLSVANTALQYSRGKQTGMAGLFGIAFALFCVYQWNHILPILNALGIVGFFDRLGLIREGAPGLTGFLILMFILRVYVVILVAFFVLAVLFFGFGIFFSTKLGGKVAMGLVAAAMMPFFVIFFIGHIICYPFNKEKINARRAEYEKENKPITQLLEERSTILDKEQALDFLNRIPTKGDQSFLLGLTNANEIYLLAPRPYNMSVYGDYKIGDLACEKVEVKKYVENKYKKKEFGIPVPERFEFKFITPAENLNSLGLTGIHHSEIEQFLLPHGKDFNYLFTWFANKTGYKNLVDKTNDHYFKRKNSLTRLISEAKTKEEFDSFVEQIKLLDANNEEVVKLMMESEQAAWS